MNHLKRFCSHFENGKKIFLFGITVNLLTHKDKLITVIFKILKFNSWMKVNAFTIIWIIWTTFYIKPVFFVRILYISFYRNFLNSIWNLYKLRQKAKKYFFFNKMYSDHIYLITPVFKIIPGKYLIMVLHSLNKLHSVINLQLFEFKINITIYKSLILFLYQNRLFRKKCLN